MEPMNTFLTQNRESFKTFIDDICYVPTPLSASTYQGSVGSSSYPPGVVTAEAHLSYTTPKTIMQRLPPTSREGFPSLPYLIDQARAFAELVQLWLEATTAMSRASETTPSAKSRAEVIAAIKASEGDLMAFHDICTTLHKRTQECLSRAERAERPHSAISFKWEELIDQLQPMDNNENGDEMPTPQTSSMNILAEGLVSDSSGKAPTMQPAESQSREWDVVANENEDDFGTRLYDITPPRSSAPAAYEQDYPPNRPGSSGIVGSLRESLRRARVESRASDSVSHSATASASASNVSSAVSSDTENTTALPPYDREKRHRERVTAAKQQIKQEVEARNLRDKDRDKRRIRNPIGSALRKKNQRESKGTAGSGEGSYMREGYASHG